MGFGGKYRQVFAAQGAGQDVGMEGRVTMGMKPDLKEATLKKDVQKVSREAIFENTEVYVYPYVSLSNISDDVKMEIQEKHNRFWEDILQTIEAHTEKRD